LPALAVLLALSAFLWLHGLAGNSLWNDEAFSYFVAWRGPAAALRLIADDVQPPFYYLVLSLWLNLGHSVVVLRGLSALAMMLAVIPVYDGLRRLVGTRTALLTTLLFVTSPWVASWTHIARPYPLQVLLVAISFWGFARVWTAPEAEDKLLGQGITGLFASGRVGAASIDLAWIAYTIGGALAVLTQYPAGFFVLGCNCAVALRVFPDLRRHRGLLLNWSLAQVLLIGVWMIWLPGMLTQFGAHLTPGQIEARHRNYLISADDLGMTLRGLLSVAYLWRAQLPFVALYAVLACSGIVHLFKRGCMLPGCVLVLAPLTTCIGGFFLLHPVFGYVIYTFVWMLPFYLMLVAAGILLFGRAFGTMLLGLVLLGNAWGLVNYYAVPTVPLDKVAGLIGAQMQPGDAIVLSESAATRWGLAYYLGPERQAALAGLDISTLGDRGLIQSLDRARGFRRVWVVLPRGEEAAVDLPALGREMPLESRTQIGDVMILCLTR
jgi:hypothetical protein